MSDSVATPDPNQTAPLEPEAVPELDAVLSELVCNADATVRRACEHWHREIGIRIVQPLHTCVLEAVGRHNQLIAKVQASNDDALLTNAAEYRASAVNEVLEPIASQLESLPFGEAIGGGLKIITEVEALAARAMTTGEFSVPLSLFTANPRQTGPIASRVAQLRMRISGRLNTLRKRSLEGTVRRVPIRAIMQYHAVVRIGGTIASLHEDLERHTASLIGLLETGLTEWTNAVLVSEREQDQRMEPLSESAEEAEESPNSDTPKPWTTVAQALTAVLEQVLDRSGALEMNPGAAFTRDADNLREDLRCAGTALLRDADRRLPKNTPQDHMVARRERWTAWFAQSRARIDLNVRIVRLHQKLMSFRYQLLQQMVKGTLKPVQEAFKQSASLLCQAPETLIDGESEELPVALQNLRAEVLEPIQKSLADLPGLLTADQVLSRPGDKQWKILLRELKAWPDTILLHAVPKTVTATALGKMLEDRNVKGDVQQVLAPLPQRVSNLGRTLRQELLDVWSRTERVVSIVEFSLGSAQQEVEVKITSRKVKNARELAQGGLQRASTAMTELLESLDIQWEQFAEDVDSEIDKAWSDVHRSLRSEDLIEDHWVSVQSRFRRSLRNFGQELRNQARNTKKIARRLVRRGHRRAATLIEHGRSAIGASTTAGRDRWAAKEAIGPTAFLELNKRLPLVYRRLFAFEPVSEPWLLLGRDSDLSYLHRHIERWRTKVSVGALVLPMPIGSGRSSLLRVFAASLEETENVSIVTLRHRYADSAEFAHEFGAAIGIEVSTLEELEHSLQTTGPRICLVDNLEHLMRQAYAGAGLLEHVLLFMARTDSYVCWIATIANLAWQYLETVHTRAAGLVSTYQVGDVNRNMLGDIMVHRHERSGLSLRFGQPDTASPLLARRLKRTRGDNARQAILKDHYFERLFTNCGSNVLLAMVYWLNSAEFGENSVRVKQWRPLSFRFLDHLDLTRDFSLKAFLVHNTLTIHEHAQVFNTSDAESYVVMESLLSLGLIIPSRLPLKRLDQAPNRIVPQTRYRVHPLLLHPVRQMLRRQNIVH